MARRVVQHPEILVPGLVELALPGVDAGQRQARLGEGGVLAQGLYQRLLGLTVHLEIHVVPGQDIVHAGEVRAELAVFVQVLQRQGLVLQVGVDAGQAPKAERAPA